MQNNFNHLENDEDLKIKDILINFFIPYWPIYAICSLIGLFVAFIFLQYRNPVYQVTSKVLVKDEKKGIADQAAKSLEDFDLFGVKKVVENELEIITSRPIIKDAVINSNAQIKIFKTGRFRDEYMGDSFPFKLVPLDPEICEWDKMKTLEFNLRNKKFILDGIAYNLNDFNRIIIDNDSFQVRCNYKNLQSFSKEKFTIELSALNDVVSNIIKNIEISTSSKSTSIMLLNMKTGNAEQGELLLNSIMQVYNNAAIIDKQMIASYTINFIDDRLALMSKQLDSVEQNLENYKSQNNIVDLSEQSKVFLNSVSKQDQELNKLGVQLSVLDEVENYMNGSSVYPGKAPSLMGIEDPMLMELLSKLYNYELQLQNLLSKTAENDDAVLSLKEQIEKIKKTIRETKSGLRQNLLSAQSKINSELDEQNSLLKLVPIKERALINISRQQAIKSSIYSFLLEKRESSAISYASTVSDGRVVEPAYCSPIPVSPKKNLILIIGLLTGFILPLLIIIIRYISNNRIQNIGEIEKMTKIPILGEMIYEAGENDFFVTKNSRSPIAESFRNIRTKLYYYFNDDNKKVLLVSSSVPDEGKTFFTLNLGLSYALTEKKTIMITGDLRKPMLHKKFNLTIDKGLSNYLINKATEDEIIYETGVDYLKIIPVGPLPPNPSELLTNGRMQLLLKYLKAHYDIIIIDTPPLTFFADTPLMAPLADACVFITRYNHTPKEILFKTIKEIENTDAYKSPNIIFNGIKRKGLSYGYEYGYGYGFEQEKKSLLKRIFRVEK